MTGQVRICSCGLIKQSKVGTSTRDGIALCNACGLPLELSPELIASAAPSVTVPAHQVTTLDALPGYRTVRALGVVTELSATSGLTATAKGTTALETGLFRLRQSAGEMEANAIVGLTSSSFGAAGGITGVLGGDAVGVLLIGTAVIVESFANDPSATEDVGS